MGLAESILPLCVTYGQSMKIPTKRCSTILHIYIVSPVKGEDNTSRCQLLGHDAITYLLRVADCCHWFVSVLQGC